MLKRLLPIIGVIIFVYLIAAIGPSTIITTLLNANPIYILLALLFEIPTLFFLTYKWNYFLKKQNIYLNFSYVMKVYIISIFYGLVTPGKLGTFIRVKYVKKKTGKGLAESSLNVLLDRIFDMTALFILAIIGSSLLIKFFSGFIYAIAATFIIFIVVVVIFLNKSLSRRILGLVHKYALPKNLKDKASESFHSFYDNLPSLGGLPFPMLIALLSAISLFTQLYFIGLSVGMTVSWHKMITILPIGTIIGLIPVTVGGLGTREATQIATLGVFGVTPEQIIAYSILSNVVLNIPFIIIGAILSSKDL